MLITYISHSGFSIEWEDCVWIFDYHDGILPTWPEKKPLFFFVSHFHGDHFNPEIFCHGSRHAYVCYLLSGDIKLTPGKIKALRRKQSEKTDAVFTPDQLADCIQTQLSKVIVMKADHEYDVSDGADGSIHMTTLKSTDSGVAFLLRYQGKTLYHAGDLNWWVWKDDSKQEYNDMTARFQQQMEKIKKETIDFAFLPLDPRQGDCFHMGFDYVMIKANVSHAFPMHCWDDYSIVSRLKSLPDSASYRDRIMEIDHKGQTWNF